MGQLKRYIVVNKDNRLMTGRHMYEDINDLIVNIKKYYEYHHTHYNGHKVHKVHVNIISDNLLNTLAVIYMDKNNDVIAVERCNIITLQDNPIETKSVGKIDLDIEKI